MDNLFFILSKTIWVIGKPETWFILAIFLAILTYRQNRKKLGERLLIIVFASSVVLAVIPIGDFLLAPLERQFPVNPAISNPAYIVVLSGGEDIVQSTTSGRPTFNQAGDRLFAAIELAHLYPDAKIILSGDSGSLVGSSVSGADIAAKLLIQLGIKPNRLLIEGASRNTAESPRYTAKLDGVDISLNTVLVTSAFHMARSMGVFCAAGWENVTAYPVDQRAGGTWDRIGWNFADNLTELNITVREWIGLLAYRATGRTHHLLTKKCKSTTS